MSAEAAPTRVADVRAASADRPQYHAISGTPQREYFALHPQSVRPGAIPLVMVHGISRNAIEHLVRFAPLARRFGVPLIAPLFEERTYGAYQRVIDPKTGTRADEALHDILAHASARWGLDVERFHLFGFSGGSQFAHRYAFLYPHRVIACVGASAGWYTWPDPALAYPKGLGTHPLGSEFAYDFDAIREVPFHVLVGKRDTERDPALRKGRRIDAQQGANRVERAERWQQAMRQELRHPATSLTEIPRTGHNFDRAQQRGLCRMVFELLGYPCDQDDSEA